MSANEPDPRPAPAESTRLPDPAAMPAVAHPPVRLSAVLAIGMAAGLLAGVVSWAVGEGLLHTFRPPLHRVEVMGQVIWRARYPDQAAADYKNATLCFGALGAILGASLGYAGGLARGSSRAGIKAGCLAMVLGGVLAAASSLALLAVYFREDARSREELTRNLTLPLLVLGGIWAAAGLAGGVGLGMGLGLDAPGLSKAGLAGLIGAGIGAALYVIAGAMLSNDVYTMAPLAASWDQRLIARLLVTSLASLLAAALAGSEGPS